MLVEMTRNKTKTPAINIDRIILTIFKGDPPNINSEVIHLNHNTLDCNINNLRWGSKEEKMAIDSMKPIDNSVVEQEWVSLQSLGFPNYECHKSGFIRRMGKIKQLDMKICIKDAA